MGLTTGAKAIVYPEGDGKPMAETDVHRATMIDLIERLAARYAARTDAYVSGNLLVYYVQGQPRVSLAPDAFVVFGVPNRQRRTYKVWEEGRYPDVVFEVTSATTQEADLGRKFEVYQDLWQVKEYFLFDPLAEYLDPPLLGYRLVRGEYQPIRPGKGAVVSKVLGITLAADGPRLVLRDAATGAEVLTPAEQRAADEQARREAAEAEIARLKAELAALRKRKA